MNRVLRKRLPRELKANCFRYLALALLIAMGMYVVVSVVGAADTIIAGSAEKAEENRIEDGQFEVFLPLTREQEKELTDTGIALERMFSIDAEARDGSVVRLMKNREDIDLVNLEEGHPAENPGEIVLEKRYCEENGWNIGDMITIYGLEFQISGTGSTPDYDMPVQTFADMAVESSRFGTGFVTAQQYEEIRETASSRAETYCYAYRLEDSGMTDGEVKQKIQALQMDDNRLLSFVKKADNPRILAAAGDMQINKEAGLLAGVIVMILFTYVISVFAIHQIQRESSVIGALYALGAKKKDLLIHYVTLPTVLTFCGGAAGALLAFSKVGIPIQMADSYRYFSIPRLESRHPVYLILYSILMPPVVSAAVNCLAIGRRLSRTALSLMRNETSVKSNPGRNLGKMKFIRLFQLRQIMRESRTGLTVICGMTIALLVLMLGLNCHVLCRNVQRDCIDSTRFEYMYSLKYPETEIPEGGEACYVESLSKTFLGYTLNVSVIGVDEDNKYYDAAPVKDKSSLVISRAVQQKYGLAMGDQLILTDSAEETDYAFTVEGVCDYAGGLAVFMDMDSMRELFGQQDGYYNMLLSDRELALDEGRIYSVTTREDVARSASVFTALMRPLVILMTVSAAIIFCMVLYLMMGVMIDRASFGISLVRVFGFRTGEIRKLYLDGNAWIVALGAAVGIPLAKTVMDRIYPWMIANTSVGMNLTFPWYLYAEVFAGVMAAYFAVNAALVRKLKRITPAEVLKNRE